MIIEIKCKCGAIQKTSMVYDEVYFYVCKAMTEIKKEEVTK